MSKLWKYCIEKQFDAIKLKMHIVKTRRSKEIFRGTVKHPQKGCKKF